MHAQILTAEAETNVGQQVELRGHLQVIRRMGNLAFLVLRDRSGTVQVVVDQPELLECVGALTAETPVVVRGEVSRHPEGNGNSVEIRAVAIQALAEPAEPAPVEIAKNKKIESLSINSLLDYRPLTLRNEKVRAIFSIEAAFCEAFRRYLGGEGFTEIHSPKIVSTGTEGGASLFSLDYFGRPVFLAQSPQFYKQMMVGVFERVFEIGPVYRAEEHDTTRHLNEYVSMDVEIGFVASEQDLMRLETELLRAMFELVQVRCAKELALYGAQVPVIGKEIPQLKLAEACALLQSKFGWNPESDGSDLDAEGERLLCEYMHRQEGSELVFVTHYPHALRPFYAMPEKGTKLSHSFDLLFRGLEITTGGQRIHNYRQLCESIAGRGLAPESFADYLQCFKHGMPPHGGFAIGLERLAKQLLGLPNVKQAALFPRDRNRVTP